MGLITRIKKTVAQCLYTNAKLTSYSFAVYETLQLLRQQANFIDFFEI